MTMFAWAVLLILVGLALLAAEVFIPSSGIIFILALLALVCGVTLVFYIPESEGGGVTAGLLTLLAVFLSIPVVVGVAFHYWPRTPMGRKFFLPEPGLESTVAAMPEHQELEQLRGQTGKALTPLRPSGVSLIGGREVDTKTEGMFVDAGQFVRVVDVRMGQVTVRPLMPDELRDLPEDLLS